MATVTIKFADGSSTRYENVPDTVTPDQVKARAAKEYSNKQLVGIERTMAPAPKEEPGWFQPGSKSEAALRGFSQGATLGFGDEIQALIRSVGSDKTYSQLRDEERGANAAAAQANPGSYLAGNVAATLPQLGAASTLLSKGVAAIPARAGTTVKSLSTGAMQTPTISTAAKTGALTGGVTGLGTGEGDVGDQLLNAGTGALVGAGGSALGSAAARGVGMVGSSVTGKTARDAAFVGPKYINPIIEQFKDRAGGAAVGAIGSAAVGGDPFYGAVGGATVGAKKLGDAVNPITTLVQAGAKKALEKSGQAMAKHAVESTSQAGRAISTGSATARALWDLSGRQKQEVKAEGDAKIQAAVNAGQPAYAATFQAKQDPAYRLATQDGDDEPAEPEPARRGTLPRTGNFVPPDENSPTVAGMARGALAGLRAYGDEALFGASPYLVAGPMVAANRVMGDGKMTLADARESAQGVLDEDKKEFPGAVNLAGAASLAALPAGLPKAGAKAAVKGVDELAQELEKLNSISQGTRKEIKEAGWTPAKLFAETQKKEMELFTAKHGFTPELEPALKLKPHEAARNISNIFYSKPGIDLSGDAKDLTAGTLEKLIPLITDPMTKKRVEEIYRAKSASPSVDVRLIKPGVRTDWHNFGLTSEISPEQAVQKLLEARRLMKGYPEGAALKLKEIDTFVDKKKLASVIPDIPESVSSKFTPEDKRFLLDFVLKHNYD